MDEQTIRDYTSEAVSHFEAECDIDLYIKLRTEGYDEDEAFRRVLLSIYRSL